MRIKGLETDTNTKQLVMRLKALRELTEKKDA